MGYGHGTVLTGSDGQGNCSVYVIDNGGSRDYDARANSTASIKSGVTVSVGDVVQLDYQSEVVVVGQGSRGTGDVDAAGTSLTVTASGDTELSGTVNISRNNGSNSGYNNTKDVTFGNTDGEAAYLK